MDNNKKYSWKFRIVTHMGEVLFVRTNSITSAIKMFLQDYKMFREKNIKSVTNTGEVQEE